MKFHIALMDSKQKAFSPGFVLRPGFEFVISKLNLQHCHESHSKTQHMYMYFQILQNKVTLSQNLLQEEEHENLCH